MRRFSVLTSDLADRDRHVRDMAASIVRNVDDIADVLELDLSDYLDKCAGLLANFIMDLSDGRTIMGPIRVVTDRVDQSYIDGVPFTVAEQDRMAARALDTHSFWKGSRDAFAYRIFWRFAFQDSRQVYHSLEWFERMHEIETAIQGDEACRTAYDQVKAAADDAYRIDETGSRQEALDAFAAYLVAREQFYTVHDAAVRKLGVDPDKVDVRTMYTEAVADLGFVYGPMFYRTYACDNGGNIAVALRNHVFTKDAVNEALKRALSEDNNKLANPE